MHSASNHKHECWPVTRRSTPRDVTWQTTQNNWVGASRTFGSVITPLHCAILNSCCALIPSFMFISSLLWFFPRLSFHTDWTMCGPRSGLCQVNLLLVQPFNITRVSHVAPWKLGYNMATTFIYIYIFPFSGLFLRSFLQLESSQLTSEQICCFTHHLDNRANETLQRLIKEWTILQTSPLYIPHQKPITA